MNDYELQRIKRQSYTKGLKDGQEIGCKADMTIKLDKVLRETKGVGEVLYGRIMKELKNE